MFIHGVLLRSASRRRRRKMQGVDAGMQGVDDRMQPACESCQNLQCQLHASVVWQRLKKTSKSSQWAELNQNVLHCTTWSHSSWARQIVVGNDLRELLYLKGYWLLSFVLCLRSFVPHWQLFNHCMYMYLRGTIRAFRARLLLFYSQV